MPSTGRDRANWRPCTENVRNEGCEGVFTYEAIGVSPVACVDGGTPFSSRTSYDDIGKCSSRVLQRLGEFLPMPENHFVNAKRCDDRSRSRVPL